MVAFTLHMLILEKSLLLRIAKEGLLLAGIFLKKLAVVRRGSLAATATVYYFVCHGGLFRFLKYKNWYLHYFSCLL
jgi:hypothetical protein